LGGYFIGRRRSKAWEALREDSKSF